MPDTRFFVPSPLDKTKYVAYRDRIRAFRQKVAALGAAAGFDESALLQTGQNEFKKLLRNLLPPRDVGDFNGFVSGL